MIKIKLYNIIKYIKTNYNILLYAICAQKGTRMISYYLLIILFIFNFSLNTKCNENSLLAQDIANEANQQNLLGLKRYLGILDSYHLHLAVVNQNIEDVKTYLTDDNVNKRTCCGVTPLFTAARIGNSTIARMLLDTGANINETNNYKETPLLVATRSGHFQVVKLLLERGADANIVNAASTSALVCACSKKYWQIAKELIKCGANVNLYNSISSTPLAIASGYSCNQIVQELIQAGANINNTQVQTTRPLQKALSRKYLGIVRTLLSYGADYQNLNSLLESLNKNSYTYKLFKRMIPVLEQFNLAYKNSDYQTLERLIRISDINLNMKHADDVNLQGNTLLGKAIIDNNINQVLWLIDKGANCLVKNYDAETAYDIDNKNNNLYKNVLKWGKSLKFKLLQALNNYELTKNNYDLKLIKLILKIAPVLINYKLDIQGNSILHYAVIRGLNDLIVAILSTDSNALSNKNNNELTALELALYTYNHSLAGFKNFLEYYTPWQNSLNYIATSICTYDTVLKKQRTNY